MNLFVRKSSENESNILTDISFSSKRYWNYPEEHFNLWKDELTITADYIRNNIVYVAEQNNKIVGYFSIVEVPKDFWAGKIFIRRGFWLEHIFILPDYIGKGIGRELISFMKNICNDKRIGQLYIFSDPNARGFYDKLGAKYIEESLSSIEGRTVSLYQMDF